jgi:hypothetical protein
MENGEDPLPFEHISPEEIAAATLSVLKAQFGLPSSDLEREVGRAFGYQRPSATARKRIKATVDTMVANNQCSRDGEMVRI